MNTRPFRAGIHPERNEGYFSNNIQQNPAFVKAKSGARKYPILNFQEAPDSDKA